MDNGLLLVLIGGFVGLASSLAATILTHYLAGRRLRAQLERENVLRREEREREDGLRRYEREREDQLRREELRRQAVLREADMLWQDIERMDEDLRHIPQVDINTRMRLERRLVEWTRRRQRLLEEAHHLEYGAQLPEETKP